MLNCIMTKGSFQTYLIVERYDMRVPYFHATLEHDSQINRAQPILCNDDRIKEWREKNHAHFLKRNNIKWTYANCISGSIDNWTALSWTTTAATDNDVWNA